MPSTDQKELARRFRTALELHELGVAKMRRNLRRKHPGASEEFLRRKLGEWLRTRPGAEFGDGCGRPVPWPREPR